MKIEFIINLAQSHPKPTTSLFLHGKGWGVRNFLPQKGIYGGGEGGGNWKLHAQHVLPVGTFFSSNMNFWKIKT